MATETFFHEDDAALDIYFRLFDETGQVFDFGDSTFKALSGATTPYVAATERPDMGGATQSGYTAAIDLSAVNNTGQAKRCVLKAYNNSTPADADDPVSGALGLTVQFGQLGEQEIVVQAEISVKSTAGLAAQISLWLEHGGRKVDINAVDAAATCSVTLREHGSGVDLFTAAGTVSDLVLDVFQIEQASPNFVDDRQYTLVASITENGVAHVTTHSRVVIG